MTPATVIALAALLTPPTGSTKGPSKRTNAPSWTAHARSSALTKKVLGPPTKGVVDCGATDEDCNRCTPNVVSQFNKVRTHQATWRNKPWRFEWGRQYPPYAIDGYQAFDEDSDLANGAGLSWSHPQGFVRANRPGAMYVGSHSRHDSRKPGTIFVVRQDTQGRKYLAALHRTRHKHPSGVHMLGKYVLFGDRQGGKSQLRMIDLDRRLSKHDITHVLPAATEGPGGPLFGGGIGAAKLSDGSYLLVSTVRGGRDAGPRYDQFFIMAGDLGRPDKLSISFVGASRYENPAWAANANKDYRYSENVSLVTECGTGDIYAIHTSGDGSGADGLVGGGYWRLSKLLPDDGGLRFRPLAVFEMSQNTANCHMRSSATVSVAPNGKLEFLCHQYRKDPDPSALNWFEANTTGNDAWGFRAGVPK